MSRGGARNRSGPTPQEGSGRSDARGFSLTALPHDYTGDVPDFPLPAPSERELQVWAEAWTFPQANAWALPSERWRLGTVAMWVRVKVRCEAEDAPASLFANVHRYADQIGMTTAGLAEMGWKVAVGDDVPRELFIPAATGGFNPVEAPARRLRVTNDGD